MSNDYQKESHRNLSYLIFVSLFIFSCCFGVEEKQENTYIGKHILVTKLCGCVWEIKEKKFEAKMDRQEVFDIIQSYGLQPLFWNTWTDLKIKSKNKNQVKVVADAIDKWYAIGLYDKEKQTIPTAIDTVDCECIKPSDLSHEEMQYIIQHPPTGFGGREHIGPWTEHCPLVDISNGWADNRRLNEITSNTFCDSPSHHGVDWNGNTNEVRQ